MVAAIVAGPAAAQKPEVYTFRGRVALDGYDVVSHLSAGRPLRGRPELEHRWKDAIWRFASAEYRDRFAAGPERCAPQFGGYGACAVSRGYAASGDPLVWRIVDDRLYVNDSKEAARLWQEDIPGNTPRQNLRPFGEDWRNVPAFSTGTLLAGGTKSRRDDVR